MRAISRTAATSASTHCSTSNAVATSKVSRGERNPRHVAAEHHPSIGAARAPDPCRQVEPERPAIRLQQPHVVAVPHPQSTRRRSVRPPARSSITGAMNLRNPRNQKWVASARPVSSRRSSID